MKPFIKCPGGKQKLISQYENHFPKIFNNYIETFVGGGAIFLYLTKENKLSKTTIIDLNDDLINAYQVIKNSKKLEKLIETLNNGYYINDSTTFYNIRKTQTNNDVEKAARFIYLNKTCFNGLYRVNKSGEFNTPFGKYKNPTIFNRDNLFELNKALINVDIVLSDFSFALSIAKKDDFIYMDPPYQPISSTSNFTAYTKFSFNETTQIRLMETFKKLDKLECKVMLSNSDCPFIRDLYKDFKIETIQATRSINCKANSRGAINEILVKNY